MVDRRSTFAPVVLVGLAAAALAAVAGAQDWVEPDPAVGGTGPTGGGPDVPHGMGGLSAAQDSPLAGALALVVLACWGVVLVTRGRFRRAVAVLGAVAALGFAVTTVAAPWALRPDAGAGLPGGAGAEVQAPYLLTGWWWVALLSAALVVATTVAAALLVRRWPEMGTRYDAPAGAAPGESRAEQTNIDLWKALDEGRDPTA